MTTCTCTRDTSQFRSRFRDVQNIGSKIKGEHSELLNIANIKDIIAREALDMYRTKVAKMLH